MLHSLFGAMIDPVTLLPVSDPFKVEIPRLSTTGVDVRCDLADQQEDMAGNDWTEVASSTTKLACCRLMLSRVVLLGYATASCGAVGVCYCLVWCCWCYAVVH